MKSIIASSFTAALVMLPVDASTSEAVANAAAANAVQGLFADPLAVLTALVSYLNADIHAFHVGPRLAVNIKVSDDAAVADIAALLGAPAPVLRFAGGHEWMESSMTVGDRTVDISSRHRLQCHCKEGRSA
jgi:hypothetical protein